MRCAAAVSGERLPAPLKERFLWPVGPGDMQRAWTPEQHAIPGADVEMHFWPSSFLLKVRVRERCTNFIYDSDWGYSAAFFSAMPIRAALPEERTPLESLEDLLK